MASRALRPADEISHYRIVGPLGTRGMGEVYLAQDRSLERQVALEVLPTDLVRDEETVRAQGETPSAPVHFIEADGSHPQQVTHFVTGEIFEMVWMPDNRRLVVGAGTSSRDAVLIRDFR